MRVAQRTISRNYLKRLNNSLQKRTESFERSTTGLKFTRLSQNVAAGVRAFKVQEQRVQSQQQLANAEAIGFELSSMDSNLESIDDILQSAQEKVLKALSENYSADARTTLAAELRDRASQVIQFANARYGQTYLFGGTNNRTAPFTTSADGMTALYNGVPVESILHDSDGYYYFDEFGDRQAVPESGDRYLDVGLGMRIGADGQIDSRTAFKVSVSGLGVLGFGADRTVTSENGVSTSASPNAYNLLMQLAQAIDTPGGEPNVGQVGNLHTQLVAVNDKMRLSRTGLGTDMSFLENTIARLTAEVDHLGEMESQLVSSDPATEAINMKMAEYVWLATLQLGAKILPTSLLDFMS